MTTAGLHSRCEAADALAHWNLSGRRYRRILIIKPSSLGDVIHALPVLHGLRSAHPTAKIDWLVSTAFAALLEGHPDLNEVVLFDRRRLRAARSPRVAGEFVRFVRRIRKCRYDLVVDLQGLFRTGFLAWATGAPVRIGFRDAREGAALFYTHAVAAAGLDTHAVDRNRAVADRLGPPGDDARFDLNLKTQDRARATELLNGSGSDGRLVAVAPGARWETKVWAAERFVETIDGLQESPGTRCVLLGGPSEIGLCEKIAKGCRIAPLNLAGRTDLRTLASIVERCALVLCLDSGVMHLAVALNRPLVCLTGPTNPRRTGPYRRIADVVRLDLECSPCYFRRLTQCCHEHRCMRDLGVDKVLAASRQRLQSAL